MKKILTFAMACVLVIACNNPEKKAETPEVAPMPTSIDSSSSKGDTSSYERMSNSMDTARKQ